VVCVQLVLASTNYQNLDYHLIAHKEKGIDMYNVLELISYS
jgi:hypothetical protein